MLDKTLKKDGKLQTRYYRVFSDLVCASTEREFKFKYCYWAKSKGHYKLIDSDHVRMMELLKDFNIPYVTGNDGKKGGLENDYILVKFDGRNNAVKFLRSMRELSKMDARFRIYDELNNINFREL